MSPTGLLTRTAPVSSAEQKDAGYSFGLGRITLRPQLARSSGPGDVAGRWRKAPRDVHLAPAADAPRWENRFIASLALAQVAVWHVSSRHFFRCLLLSLLLTFALALDLHRETRFVAVRFPQLRIRPRWLVGTKVAPLVGRVTALHRWLDLTPWAFFNHVQTVLLEFEFVASCGYCLMCQRTQTGLRDVWKVMERLVTEKVDLMYLQHSCSTWATERCTLSENCSNAVMVDWICLEGEGPPSSDCSEIIVLHLPGIVGVFSNQYLLRFARHTRLRCVVKSWRGIGCRLTSGRPETWDLQAVEDGRGGLGNRPKRDLPKGQVGCCWLVTWWQCRTGCAGGRPCTLPRRDHGLCAHGSVDGDTVAGKLFPDAVCISQHLQDVPRDQQGGESADDC
ncbi:Uncharacterized protein SCF082_LOCUS7330 [Durusdinium trenchii]|uniref:Uncharacterized protein n=1 Tax=Durusdinium trenchii TaxID=1381693 RepID=A0ABP0IJD7_9DINO